MNTQHHTCPHCHLDPSDPYKGHLYQEGFELGRAYRLSGGQARIFAMLYAANGKTVSKRTIYDVLYTPFTAPKIIDVQLYKIRRKLEKSSWQIETDWGVGLRLTNWNNKKETNDKDEESTPT